MNPFFPYLSRRLVRDSATSNEYWNVKCRAIGKFNTTDHPYLVANEWISASLASILRLPMPPFALMRKRTATTVMFSSISYEGTTTPDDIIPERCFENPELANVCTGVLLFDVLVANCDRHAKNMKVDDPANPKRVYIFDHDRALFYIYAKEGIERLRSRKDRLGITDSHSSNDERHCLVETINTASYMRDWAERIRWIPEWYIKDICSDVLGFGIKRKEHEEAVKFLVERKENIGHLILSNKSRFPKIHDWPLII